jgi:aldehyde dehydrogenase (NAD+)
MEEMTTLSTETKKVSHLIGGEWVGELQRERRNPADPADVVAVVAGGDADDAAAAVSAAQEAQPAWAKLGAVARGQILLTAAELLAGRAEYVARDLTREEGKTLAESRGEIARAVGVLRYFGGEGWRLGGETLPSAVDGTLIYTRREPLGVVAAITPWNFPIAIPAWKLAPALVAGNTAVLKPAGITSLTASHLISALQDAGLPAGVLNLVHGSGGEVGEALVRDDRVAGVSFTGSVAVGRRIHELASARMARVQLEMGGKNPLVVLDDADPDQAARVAAAGAFALTGQACTATSRVLVTPRIASAFLEALRAQAERYTPGNGLVDGVLMGPVVSEAQLETDRLYLQVAVDEGGELVTGSYDGEGLFFRPAVISGVGRDDRLAQEEVFGPVVGLIEVADLDEAISIANDTDFGLAAGICTSNLSAAHRFAEEVQAGVVKVNRPTTGLDLNVPFGGVKASSTNTFREQGAVAVEFYSWTKAVYVGYR